MNILVTGGCGYIGKYLLKQLSKENKILVIDNLSNSQLDFDYNIINVDFEILDLLDIDKLENIFVKYKFDLVIHLAAFKSVSESINKSLDYYYNNIITTLNLIKMCDKYNCNNFIFISSASVYKSSDNKLEEISNLEPTNPYGQTKLICEQLLKDYCNENKNFNCTTLRLFNVVGGIDKSKKVSTNLIPNIINSIVTNEQIYITTTSYRDYVSVFDVVNIINLLVNNLDYNYTVYNIGTGKSYTAKDVVEKFEQLYKIKINYKLIESRKGDATTLVADNTKIKNKLNYKFLNNLTEILC